MSSVCLCVACSSSFSLLLLSSLSGVKWLKNDLKTSPLKVFFFEDFLNFSTSRQLVIFSPFYTHARTNNTQTFREEEEEEEEREREIRSRVVVSVVFMVVLVEE